MKKIFTGMLLHRHIPKFDLKMKLTTFLLIVSLFEIQANSYAQGTKLTLNLENASIEQIFDEIESISEFRFLYESAQIDLNRKVTLRIEGKKIADVLALLFDHTNIAYKTRNRQVILTRKAMNRAAPLKVSGSALDEESSVQSQITGVVTDADGAPLPGANILEKGTTNGTQTDFDGKFVLDIADDSAVLVISYIGFATKEVSVNGQSNITIGLIEDAAGLEEVVVVGYGTVRKKDLTGSVASVKGTDLEKTPTNTFVQALQGKASGVDIRAASNAPGGGIRIRVRGTNSINASSQPLYVVDGFPIDNGNTTPEAGGNRASASDPLTSISPAEIASIQVLKDASATAIYGARGANGVVIVTTKRGGIGKAKIDFEYSTSISSVRKKLDLANAEELAILTNEWAINNNQPLIYDGVNKPFPEDLGEGTDWQDQIFRSAITNNYNLTVSGGREGTRYLVSGNYMDQDGIIIESNFKRAGLKFNLDQDLGKRLKFGMNANITRTINDAVDSDGGGYQNDTPLWNALATTPVIPVTDSEGNYVHNHDETVKVLENPVSIAKTRTDITYATRVLSNAFLQYQLFNGLSFKANFGADLINSKRNAYTPTTAETQALPNKGIASVGNVQRTNLLAEYTFNYNRSFGDRHRLDAVIGYTYQNNKLESVFSRTDDFFTDLVEFNNLELGSDPRPSKSGATKTALLSYLGRVNYVFADKYIATASIRRDGSSKFGTGKKWGVFPSGAIAWRLVEEDFIKNLNVFSALKLRGSYGLTGNESIGAYNSLALYAATNQPIIGGVPVVGLAPNRINNPDLKWERTKQTDVGLEMGLFEGRLNLEAGYYVKTTEDLLLSVAIPTQSGYTTSVQNIGKVENRGFEFDLGMNHTFGKLTWNSNFNISFNRNKLLELPEGTDELINGIGRGETAYGQSIAQVGKPLGQFFGYRFDGIWESEEEIVAGGNSVGGVNRVGLPKYRDLNGDGFNRNLDDKEVVGDPNPDFIYGFTNSFAFKNLNLSIYINGSQGNDLANMNTIGLFAQPQKHNVLQKAFDERWQGPGTGNTIEAPLTNAGEWKNFSDRNVEDGSYLRVKTINLSYNLPIDELGLDWCRSAQLFIAADNLITVTNYSGFDPEVDLYASNNVSFGVDNGAYPSSRSFRIGMKLGF
ncbi:TonB-dependent receptor [Kriegella aquimaris]|uniref:TonB-linked outer membrane protein, SusC/RagA family n=1 Tax=Kriegella aquimaris TaxID=192904 RepID=A0A1G9Q3A6_9FLAO|nr:TonB-dependent receptor [Kriegella aquimaris]SDM05469.1 TonB-linked outer membrane protein, SusC/RagA family [Kriegella aquimaris]